MEIKGIKKINSGSYILQKTKNRVDLEHKKIMDEEYKITEDDIKSLAKMQSADGIKRVLDELGKFIEEPELEMQR